jgi:tRNA(Ile2) C34 agmatinyltransferase TiaS
MVLIGLDDTDTRESRGTGHLARQIAVKIGENLPLLGVTRHQLLQDPRVPSTSKNSCAAILLDINGDIDTARLFEQVRGMMLQSYQPGSDPGLCIAHAAPDTIIKFGHAAQRQLVTQEEARQLAQDHGLLLEGLGGTQDGVIGALAAVGLAACGDDGRYVLVGQSRQLHSLLPVSALLDAGIAAVQTRDGQTVRDGLVQADKLRPARRGGQPIVIVDWSGEHWQPLKLD